MSLCPEGSGHTRDLLAFPGIVTTTLRTDATNSDALRTMAENSLDAVLIVDDKQKIAGVVEREQLIATMLLAATP